MPLINHSFQIALTPSGAADSRYQNGDDGSAAIPLAWAVIPSILNAPTGTPISVSMRTYLTEPGSPSATLALVGTPPSGWSLSGDNLTYSGTGTGSAPVQISATRNGFSVLSNFFTIQSITAPSTDTVPPTQITGLVATVTAGPSVTLAWDAPSDIKTTGITASLMKDCQVYRGGSSYGSPVASAPGISAQLAFASIGSPSPALSGTSQVNADYAFTVGGDASNIYGTADAIAFPSVQITGNFTVIAEVDFATSANAFAKIGLMVRASLAASDAFVNLVKFSDSSANGVNLEWRASTGGSGQQATRTPAISGRTLLKLTRVGALFSGYYWNGTQWALQGSVSIGMTDPVWVGLSGNSGSSGASISATVRQFNLQNIAGGTFVDNSVSLGATYNYTVISRDLALNVAAAGASVTVFIPSGQRQSPTLSSNGIGGSPRADDRDPQIGYMQSMCLNVVNRWDGWEQGDTQSRIRNAAQSDALVKSGSLWPTGTLQINYNNPLTLAIDPTNTSKGAQINIAAINGGNWLVRDTYPSGSVKAASYWSATYSMGNFTAGGPTFNSLTYQQYAVKYIFDYMVAGGAAGLAVRANVPNPYLDGWLQDDVFLATPAAGDWNRDGTSEAKGDATQSQRLRDSHAAMAAAMRALKPGFLIFANVSQMQNPASVSTGCSQVYDGGLMEGMLGYVWSQETFGGFDALIAAYKKQVGFVKDPTLLMFGHANITTDGRDFYRTAPYQAIGYGLTTCLLGPAMYSPDYIGNAALTNANSKYDNNKFPQWFDEFSINPATGVYLPYGSHAPGLGWLGFRQEALFPGPWLNLGTAQNPVYIYRTTWKNPTTGKVFWSITNPKNNGTRTIPLGQPMKCLTGGQNPTKNSGATVNQITLIDSDGQFLMVP